MLNFCNEIHLFINALFIINLKRPADCEASRAFILVNYNLYRISA
jgi:hypothetical protein